MGIWSVPFIILWVFLTLCFLASLAVYSTFKIRVDQEIDDVAEVCDADYPNIDYFTDSPLQTMYTYVFNVSNPGEYLAGGDANLHEKGPYVWDLQLRRRNVEFYDGGKRLNYSFFNSLTFNEDNNCKGCGNVYTEQVTVPNPLYLAMLSRAFSEAHLLMASTCTQQQIGLLKNNAPAPYCLKTQVNNPAVPCRCCVPPGLSDVDYGNTALSFCSDVTSAKSRAGSLISWLSMYDGGYRMDSVLSPAFPLASGTFTPLLRTYSVAELLTGSMSALAGTLQFSGALPTVLTNPESAATIEGIVNSTRDMKEVCYNPNYDFCPQLSEVLANTTAITSPNPAVQQQLRVAYLRTIHCSGNIPGYDDLVNTGGLTSERALDLRYIEGLPCNNFAPAIAMAALISISPASSGVCADGGALPCCLRSFSLQGGASTGSGVGCLRYIDGVLQKRRVFSAEEAVEVIGTTVSQKTVCNGDSKLTLFEWNGDRQFKEWFTPDSYVFGAEGSAGVMPWADPSKINTAGTAPNTGTFSNIVVADGRAVNQIDGKGLGRSFLARNLNNGEVRDPEWNVYATHYQRVLPVHFVKNEMKYGLQAARFEEKISKRNRHGHDDGDDADEASETSGQLPYPNMYNMIYTELGRPAILSRPNWLNVNEAMYSQDNNAKRGFPDGLAGVKLFRTRAEYDPEAEEIAPEVMTESSVENFRGSLESFWNYEPATGLTITNRVTGMFSMFTLNCDPALDSLCSVKVVPDFSGLCYPGIDEVNDTYTSPCSFANVMTPNVHGEKVFPLYWNSLSAKPPQSAIDKVTRVLDIRFVFSILIIIFTVLMFILIIYTIFAWQNASMVTPPASADAAAATGDGDIKKEAAPNGEIALTDVPPGQNL